MSTQPLGEAIEYLRGITFKPEQKVDPSTQGAVVCMRTKNVQETLDQSDLIAVPEDLVRNDELFLRPNDILISSANSGNLVGKCCLVPPLTYRATAGGFISIIRAKDGVDGRYLFHWLSSPPIQERIRACARQTTNIANLSVPQFEAIRFPVVEAREQQRIAGILDKANTIRLRRREAVALTEELLRSTFLEMIGDPVTNPRNFPKRALGEMLQLRSGEFLPAKAMDPTGKHPVYGGNGVNGFHSRYLFEEPQIVIGRVGVYCGVVHRTPGKCWITDNALYVSSRSEELTLTYLEHALRMANLNQYASQSAQPLISGGRIYPVMILVPPTDVQEAFDAVVSSHRVLVDRQARALAETSALASSLAGMFFESGPFAAVSREAGQA